MTVKARTFCFSAAAGAASCNADFSGAALAVLIKITVGCLASDTDVSAGSACNCICHAVCSLPETFTAGFIWSGGITAADGDIPFGTEVFFVVHTVFYRTF